MTERGLEYGAWEGRDKWKLEINATYSKCLKWMQEYEHNIIKPDNK